MQARNQVLRYQVAQLREEVLRVEAFAASLSSLNETMLQTSLRELRTILPTALHEITRLSEAFEHGTMTEEAAMKEVCIIVQKVCASASLLHIYDLMVL